MSEERKTPGKFWNNALKTVKGENTAQLIEQFTSEMTLVAEGLYEDQSKLHQKLTETEESAEKLNTDWHNSFMSLEHEVEEMESTTADKLADIYTRLQNVEASVEKMAKDRENQPKPDRKKENFMKQLTVLVGIVAVAAVIIAVISLFH